MDPIMIKRQTKTKHTEATAKGWRNRRPDPGGSGESVVFLFSSIDDNSTISHYMLSHKGSCPCSSVQRITIRPHFDESVEYALSFSTIFA
jgi:hypothetical protein